MPSTPKTITSGKPSSAGGILAWIGRGVVILVCVMAFFSLFRQIPADSEGVVTRFGKYVGTVGPGLQFKMPIGIDRIVIVPVKRQLKLEFGFTTPGSQDPLQGSRNEERETIMVTGDLNMALVEWVVQYHVLDSKKFVFHVRDPGDTLRDASESAMREVIGDRTVDEVLTVGRQDVENQALMRLKELAHLFDLGIAVDQIQLQDVHPPKPVQASFNEVNQAQQERERQINVANGEYNKAVPLARGTADKTITEAQGYALRRVNEAQGDAERFSSQLAEYIKAPEVTRQRLYLEAMSEILPYFKEKIIIDSSASQMVPFFPLDLKKKAVELQHNSNR